MNLAIALLLAAPPSLPGPPVEEATVAPLQQWMTEGRYTSHQLV